MDISVFPSKSVYYTADLRQPHAHISIADRDGEWPALKQTGSFQGRVRLSFADATTASDAPDGQALFDAGHADLMLDFFRKVHGRTELLIIDSPNGKRRARAVGAAIRRVLGLDVDNILPTCNMHVYETMTAAARRRGLI